MSAAAAGLYGLALYAGHHVGDYWVQTDHQAQRKGAADGAEACVSHVLTYTATQGVCVVLAALATGAPLSPWAMLAGLTVSAVTHYLADRREYGFMFWLARNLGKASFMKLGVPQELTIYAAKPDGALRGPDALDNPTLGTGSWALDQSWHIFWGVFVAALLVAGLS